MKAGRVLLGLASFASLAGACGIGIVGTGGLSPEDGGPDAAGESSSGGPFGPDAHEGGDDGGGADADASSATDAYDARVRCGDAGLYCTPPEFCELCDLNAPRCETSFSGSVCAKLFFVHCQAGEACDGGLCCVSKTDAAVVACAANAADCQDHPLCDPTLPADCAKTCQPADAKLQGTGYFNCR